MRNMSLLLVFRFPLWRRRIIHVTIMIGRT